MNKYMNLTTGNIVIAVQLKNFSYSNVHDVIKLNGQNVNNLSFIESEKFSDFCYYCSLNGYVTLKGFEKIKLGQYLVNENNKTFIYDQYKFERRFKMYKI